MVVKVDKVTKIERPAAECVISVSHDNKEQQATVTHSTESLRLGGSANDDPPSDRW
ncbi:hypothetical protein PILCRDRAFT_824722 [Piloderma croceum F 1598]|uniref:Uncharacterized protein n=1 Tax=Piloderma croceum (strain F 1598) TaxID=765440 RepID=A0A0C3F0C6_PILCF|nr:hypothetical protein PILCRDRAFT_824722 [Piloderma croceum F 1598]